MPPLDSCHNQVSHALQKEGWTIQPRQARFDADILAVIDIEANKADEHAYIEVKCFPGANTTQEYYIAFGQYVIYRTLLSKIKPEAVLYLAVPEHVYYGEFTETIYNAIQDNRVKLIIVNLTTEVIVQWQ